MSGLYLRLGRACNWLGARLLDAEEWFEASAMRAEDSRLSRDLTVCDRTSDCEVAAAIRFGGNFWVRHTSGGWSETTPEHLAMELSRRWNVSPSN